MKSLNKRGVELADPDFQRAYLNQKSIPSFQEKLTEDGLHPIKPAYPKVLQMNLGYMCNQTCKHCHVDAGPDRKERMSMEVLQACLDIVDTYDIQTVDLTGGAPEMHREFKWLVDQLHQREVHIIDRCNLTILVANASYRELPSFLAERRVEVVSSLPHFTARRTNIQRGDNVFERSIEALKLLNKEGYGTEGSGLVLNLVYNPTGAFLPDSQSDLEKLYKDKLWKEYGIVFNSLYAITNLPIARFLEYLIESANYDMYMEKLLAAYNPQAVLGLMCRDTISVDYDGRMYDCDFNQMLSMPVQTAKTHVMDFDMDALMKRTIATDLHCYGCTAGAGSSCGGNTV